MYKPYVDALKERLGGIEFQELTEILARHKLFRNELFGRDASYQFKAGTPVPEAICHLLLSSTLKIQGQSKNRVRLCEMAERFQPETGYAQGMRAVLLLSIDTKEECRTLARGALPDFAAYSRDLPAKLSFTNKEDASDFRGYLDNLHKQLLAISEGRVTLAAYKPLVSDEHYSVLADMLRHQENAMDRGDECILFHPSGAISLANSMLMKFLEQAAKGSSPSLAYCRVLELAAALDPTEVCILSNAAMGLHAYSNAAELGQEERDRMKAKASALARAAIPLMEQDSSMGLLEFGADGEPRLAPDNTMERMVQIASCAAS